MAGGVLRVPPVPIEADGIRISAELGLDLAEGVAHADADVRYEAGEDTLVGSDPSVRLVARGPLEAMEVSVDTDPLSRFLTQRALEREAAARRRHAGPAFSNSSGSAARCRYFAALRQDRLDREVARRQAEEEAQRQLEDEVRRRAEAEERRRVDTERRQAEEEAWRLEQEEARRRAQQEAEIRLEQERQRVEEARRRAEEAAQAEEERRRQLETDIESILELQGRVGDFVLPTPSASRAPIFRPETLSGQGLSGGN